MFQIDRSTFRRYDSKNDPNPIRDSRDIEDGEITEDEGEEETSHLGSAEFAYESDLKNYLAKNLSIIEAGLTLYEDEGISGIEFPVGGRFVDILGVDSNNNLVVIELKVSRGYDKVIGQLMRYMAWIKNNQAENGQSTRGIIIAREISTDLKLACSLTTDIQLFEYELSLQVRQIETAAYIKVIRPSLLSKSTNWHPQWIPQSIQSAKEMNAIHFVERSPCLG